MATNNDIANIKLVINGQDAQKKLDDINAKLQRAKKLREDAFNNGDNKAFSLYNKEAQRLETQLQRVRARTQGVAETLSALDKATPKQLREAIKELNRQLNSGSVERNSEQWRALVSQIGAAKKELESIREETEKASTNLGQKILSWGDAFTGITNTLNIGPITNRVGKPCLVYQTCSRSF